MSGRCLSCDAKLTTYEMCRKHATTGEYFSLCNNCLKEVMSMVNLPIVGDTSFIDEQEWDEGDEEQAMS